MGSNNHDIVIANVMRLLVIFFNFHFSTSLTTNLTDVSALLALKSQFLLKPNDTLSSNWTLNSSLCDWIGVTCGSRHQRVTALNLSYMDLHGTISPYIGNLSFLTFLNIRNNSLHGPIPETVGRLRRLRVINVRYNQLGGNIPPSLAQCQKLEQILLGPNYFQGSIPKEIGDLSHLKVLEVRESSLTGNIPSAIFNISSLLVIDIIDNNIVGNIPIDICHRLPKLQLLYLSDNPLGGSFPKSLCQCEDLREIEVAQNRLTGSIPKDIGCLSKLEYVNLARNQLTGTVPPSLGNLSMLLQLELIDNYLWGEIPEELTRLSSIGFLRIGFNNLSGKLPQSIFNLSSAEVISFMENNLTGNIPEFKSLQTPELQTLNLFRNRLDGKIPNSVSNASKLNLLELSKNSLSGQVPTSLGNLPLLETLNLQTNQLSNGPSQRVLHFLTSLTRCRHLRNLVIGQNPLNGELPNSIGNLSSFLEIFSADASQMKGSLPSSIGNLSNLLVLELAGNNLTGIIPSSVGNLGRLQRFLLYGNSIGGRIPAELCGLSFLGEFLSDGNNLTGPIPQCFGNLSRMLELSLSSNALESIPISLWHLSDMWYLNLSSNFLLGYLPPDIEKLTKIQIFDLSKNRLSGNVPESIFNLVMLKNLNLSNNSFKGSIPEAIGKLVSLESLDLSSNSFTGEIPKSLANLSDLRYLNLSYNELIGEVPTGGIFNNLTRQSLVGNDELCSSSVPKFHACRKSSTLPKWRKISFWIKYIFPPLFAATTLVILVISYLNRRRKSTNRPSVEISEVRQHRFISYNELVHATDNFNEVNLLGIGSFGSVYKGTMFDGELIAVKTFNMEMEGGLKSFDRECEVLRNVRHRNVLKIISSCSNLDFRALVFPYLPNGNLERLLYSGQPVEFLLRLNIMIDVAMGIEYLHHGYSEPVVHCDIKPSNVLLEANMVAHVSDFGIAKILAESKSMTLTAALGTVGYIAPEYGLGGKAWTKGDVYSYGIMLMETFTRKKPSDEMFGEGKSFRQWVNCSFPEQLMEVVDSDLFTEETSEKHLQLQRCLSSIMELGLSCSCDSPEDRPNMERVVATLTNIKRQYLSVIPQRSMLPRNTL